MAREEEWGEGRRGVGVREGGYEEEGWRRLEMGQEGW